MAEKYYDCLQCAEQCRHATNVTTSNNNNNSSSNNNNVKLAKTAKNSNPAPKGGLNNCRAANPIGSATTKESTKGLARLDEARAQKNPKSANLSRSLKNQPVPLTPAKKRSSLARPVRVHDSFPQPRKLVPANYTFQMLQKRETSESTYEDDEHEETSRPIRLRLEQMLELTLPQTRRRRKKKKMRLMKQQEQSRHVCKDTERLLRVLSVNNVDQDNRYNDTRCSVM